MNVNIFQFISGYGSAKNIEVNQDLTESSIYWPFYVHR